MNPEFPEAPEGRFGVTDAQPGTCLVRICSQVFVQRGKAVRACTGGPGSYAVVSHPCGHRFVALRGLSPSPRPLVYSQPLEDTDIA